MRAFVQGARRRLSSFAVLNASATLLNSLYTFVQLVVFARVLEPDRFSSVIFLTAISLYLQPLSQAVGRANYMVLRARTVQSESPERSPEAVLLPYASAASILLALLLSPFLLGWSGQRAYAEDALYMAFCLTTNFWYFDLKSSAWAVDLGPFAEALSLLQRLSMFVALALLWLTGDFLVFGLAALLSNAAFFTRLIRTLAARSAALSYRIHRGDLGAGVLKQHLQRLWTALQATFTELIVLNSPYLVLSAVLGVGPALVLCDTVLKLTRLAMTGARILSEITLPRLSRLLLLRDAAGARSLYLVTTGLSLAGAAVLAGFMLLYGPLVFGLLLGPNNVMPPEASLLTAVIILIGALYQPAMYFLSYNEARREVAWLTLFAASACLVFGLAVWAGGLDPVGSMWVYAAFFLAASLCAVLLAQRVLRGLAPPPRSGG